MNMSADALLRRTVSTISRSCVIHVITLLIAAGAYAAEEIRTWSDDTGQHKREAVLVRRDGETVFLRLKDGREIPIKYDRLSKADRDFVDAAGSNKQPERASFRELLARQTPRRLPPTGLSVTDQEESELLGKRVEKALADGVDQVVSLFDVDQFAKQTMEGIELPPEGATALTTQAHDNLKQMVLAVMPNTQRGFGPLRFIRGRLAGTSKRLLFRTVNKTTGLAAYCEFIYVSPASVASPLTDIWLFHAGETASNTLRRGNIMIAGAINQSFVSKLVAGDAEFAKYQGELERVIELHKQGNVADALAALKTLPDSVRKDKTWLLVRINWADQANSWEEYTAAVGEYERIYPRDPSLAFVRLASVAAGNDKALFMETIDKVDAAVGGDPLLMCLRGAWLQEKAQDNAAAKAYYLQAIAMNPKSPEEVLILLMHDLNVGAYAEVADVLEYCEEECGMDADKVVSAMGSDFEGFLASAEGKEWKAAR